MDIYNKQYLLSDYLEGYEEFKKGQLSFIKSKLLDMLALKKDISLLEIGSGRGEFLYHCAKRGARVTGIDLSEDAIEITKETLKEVPGNVCLADTRSLPFNSNTFDRVFAGDMIEHLSYEDAVTALKEMKRVLKSGGFLLIHTSPNNLFIYLLPLFKYFLDKGIIKKLDDWIAMSRNYHLHEYNLFSLKTLARKAGLFRAKAWIDDDITRSGKHRFTETLKGNFTYLKWLKVLIGNDLYLKYEK